MGILVNFISADDSDIDAISESEHPVAEWQGVEVRDIDVAKIATLHTLLTGDSIEDVIYAYEPVNGSGMAIPLVLCLPEEVTAKLANLDETAAESVGEELAYTVEFEMSQIPYEEVQSLIMDLAELARIAVTHGQSIFIWMHPLQT